MNFDSPVVIVASLSFVIITAVGKYLLKKFEEKFKKYEKVISIILMIIFFISIITFVISIYIFVHNYYNENDDTTDTVTTTDLEDMNIPLTNFIIEDDESDITDTVNTTEPETTTDLEDMNIPLNNFTIEDDENDNVLSGKVTFDYSKDDGRRTIGEGEYEFTTDWSKASRTSIYAHNYAANIESIARIKNIDDINKFPNIAELDFTSRGRNPEIGDAIVWINKNGYVAVTKIESIKDDNNGDEYDEITFSYNIFKIKVETPKSNNTFHSTELSGQVIFDYSSNSGYYSIGIGEYEFTTRWSQASRTAIHAYSWSENIESIAIIKNIDDIFKRPNIENLEFSSSSKTPEIGDAIVWINKNGYVAVIKVVSIKNDKNGDEYDEITFSYNIFKIE